MIVFPYLYAPPPHALQQDASAEELDALRARLDELEAHLPGGEPSTPSIDLSGDELPALYESSNDVLALPWFENVTLSGYAAAGFLDLGRPGHWSDGGFTVRQSTLFVDAQTWENSSVFMELWLSRLSQYEDEDVRTGELYLRLHDLSPDEDGEGIDVKIGRVDIPFGDEYLRQDATDNFLISQSAAWPYGTDEGLLVSGRSGSVNWVGAIMDGTIERGLGGDSSKALVGKLYGKLGSKFQWSTSALHTGKVGVSALKFAGMSIKPVGSDGAPSTAGTSPSPEVETLLLELDGRWLATPDVDLLANVGTAAIEDEAPGFDRDVKWYSIEPRYRLTRKLTAVARWSEIGTFDDDEGFLFHGSFVGFGTALGYDTQRLSRASIGLAFDFNPHTRFKLEVGRDHFDVINGSPLDPANDDRTYFGGELVLSF